MKRITLLLVFLLLSLPAWAQTSIVVKGVDVTGYSFPNGTVQLTVSSDRPIKWDNTTTTAKGVIATVNCTASNGKITIPDVTLLTTYNAFDDYSKDAQFSASLGGKEFKGFSSFALRINNLQTSWLEIADENSRLVSDPNISATNTLNPLSVSKRKAARINSNVVVMGDDNREGFTIYAGNQKNAPAFRYNPSTGQFETVVGNTVMQVGSTARQDVRSFGAKGDGITDDTTAFAKAATAAAGKELYIGKPDVEYLITTSISIPSNTTVTGDGATSVIKLASGNQSGLVVLSNSNVTIKNLRIYATAVGTSANIGGVVLQNATNCKVENVTLQGLSWAGVYLYDSSSNRVEKCWFQNFQGTVQDSSGVAIRNNSNNNVVYDNDFNGNSDHAVLIQDPYTASTPTGNQVSTNRITAHKAYGVAVYTTTTYNTKTIVENNLIRDIAGTQNTGTSGAGVYIQSAAGTIVRNNRISNTCTATTNFTTLAPAGIGVTTAGNGAPVLVEGNIIDGIVRGAGIAVQTSPGKVILKNNSVEVNNSLATTFGTAINISNAPNVLLDGNTIRQLNSNYFALNIVSNALSNIPALLANNTIESAGYGVGFNSIGGGTFKGLNISGGSIKSDLYSLFISAASDSIVNGISLNSATSYSLYLGGALRTKMTNVQMVNRPAFTGINTGSFLDKSSQWTGNLLADPGNGVIIEQFGTAPPTTGNWDAGSIVIHSAPAVGQPKAWRCTAAGAPGTWVSEGNL